MMTYLKFSRGCILTLVFLLAANLCLAASNEIRGLPYSRAYPLDEIGYAPRSAQLDFDTYGRLAVIREGVYAVLNDTVWLNLADEGRILMGRVVKGYDNKLYYGARGSWGSVRTSENGILVPNSLTPSDKPKWTNTAFFTDLVPTSDGIYFGSLNGIVYWNPKTSANIYIEAPQEVKLFSIGQKAYVSLGGIGLAYVDVENRTLKPIPGLVFEGLPVEHACSLGDNAALLSLVDGRLFSFDGTRATPWIGQTQNDLYGRITSLKCLVDGLIALAINGRGVYLIDSQGNLVLSLTTFQYQEVTDIANKEQGVLWIASEDSVEKVLYNSPLSSFGHKLGIPLRWPTIVKYLDKTFVASDGKLYEASPRPNKSPSTFELSKQQPPEKVWSIVSDLNHMLVGGSSGIYSYSDGNYIKMTDVAGLTQLVMVPPNLCYAISPSQICVLEYKEGTWKEAAPRIPGLGYAPIARASKHAAWVELATEGIAQIKLSRETNSLVVKRLKPWEDSIWFNVGVADDTIIITGLTGQRTFYDEVTSQYCTSPELSSLCNKSSHWIVRLDKDDKGNLWGMTKEGVVFFTRNNGSYSMNETDFDLINDLYPRFHQLPDNDIWLSASQSLHHVESLQPVSAARPKEPTIVSFYDGRNNKELLSTGLSLQKPFSLNYSQNNISITLFSGSYASRRNPIYEYKFADEKWTRLDSGSILGLRGLREGDYSLDLRISGSHGLAGPSTRVHFTVLPPWYRSSTALVAYCLGCILLVAGLIRWSGHLSRKRNQMLEGVVKDRTQQLKSTMERLNEETRLAATLAERDRLAGEVHDSLQQGLSGAILQLDATIKLPAVTGDVRSRLNVARNMISFTRHEVQHAVWDKETSLLESGELGAALEKLTSYIDNGTTTVRVVVSGTPHELSSEVKHHLLRVAQEATTNAVRHAHATLILVQLTYDSESVTLTVFDDGVGFNPDDILAGNVGHFGLHGLRRRAMKIGGDLVIESTPTKGTKVQITVRHTPANKERADGNQN